MSQINPAVYSVGYSNVKKIGEGNSNVINSQMQNFIKFRIAGVALFHKYRQKNKRKKNNFNAP